MAETVSGFGRWGVFWRATDRASYVGTLHRPKRTGNDRVLSLITKRKSRPVVGRWRRRRRGSGPRIPAPFGAARESRTRPPTFRSPVYLWYVSSLRYSDFGEFQRTLATVTRHHRTLSIVHSTPVSPTLKQELLLNRCWRSPPARCCRRSPCPRPRPAPPKIRPRFAFRSLLSRSFQVRFGLLRVPTMKHNVWLSRTLSIFTQPRTLSLDHSQNTKRELLHTVVGHAASRRASPRLCRRERAARRARACRGAPRRAAGRATAPPCQPRYRFAFRSLATRGP